MKWVKQLGIRNKKDVIEKMKKHEVDGRKLCTLKSAGDLAKLWEISIEDAQIIFKSIESLRSGTNTSSGRLDEIVQDDCCKEDEDVSPVISAYERTPPDFYETFEESLKSANFKNVQAMMKYSREIATYLDKQGVLGRLGMTKADGMALAVYTYDNGVDDFESNPYRIVNKILRDGNQDEGIKLKGYILRLISALRKIPPYSEKKKKTLYRAVINVSEKCKEKNNILTWPAFTSTSSDEASVVDFFNNISLEGDKYVFEITGCFKKGHLIKDFSFHLDEDGTL